MSVRRRTMKSSSSLRSASSSRRTAIEMSNDRGKVAGESVGSMGRSASGVGAVRAKNPAIGPQTSATSTSPRPTAATMGSNGARIGVVAEDREPHHVRHDAAPAERVRRRAVRAVVADHLDADAEAAQPGVVERRDVQVRLAARDEDIGGAIVGPGRQDCCGARGQAHDDVASSGVEGGAQEAAALRRPGVFEPGAAIGRKQVGQTVLESVRLPRRVREIVRIGADARRSAARARWHAARPAALRIASPAARVSCRLMGAPRRSRTRPAFPRECWPPSNQPSWCPSRYRPWRRGDPGRC